MWIFYKEYYWLVIYMKKFKLSSGWGIFIVTQLVFLVLRIFKLIDWSWFFVMLPSCILGVIAMFSFIIIWIYQFMLKENKTNV